MQHGKGEDGLRILLVCCNREIWSWREHLAKSFRQLSSSPPICGSGAPSSAAEQNRIANLSQQLRSSVSRVDPVSENFDPPPSLGQWQCCSKDWKGFGVTYPNSWEMGETGYQPGHVRHLWSWSPRLKHPRARSPCAAKPLAGISLGPFGKFPVKCFTVHISQKL